MTSSMIFLYFSVVLIIWSSCAASDSTKDTDIGKKYQDSNGTIILYHKENHPNKLCAAAMSNSAATWADYENRCSKNIICTTGQDKFTFQLEEKPVTGVVCAGMRDFQSYYSVCIDEKCIDLPNGYLDEDL